MYQSFWTLTASSSITLACRAGIDGLVADPRRLKSQAILKPASRLNLTPEQVMYQFCVQEGITPLNGTTSNEHAALGVQVLNGEVGQLSPEETKKIQQAL